MREVRVHLRERRGRQSTQDTMHPHEKKERLCPLDTMHLLEKKERQRTQEAGARLPPKKSNGPALRDTLSPAMRDAPPKAFLWTKT